MVNVRHVRMFQYWIPSLNKDHLHPLTGTHLSHDYSCVSMVSQMLGGMLHTRQTAFGALTPSFHL